MHCNTKKTQTTLKNMSTSMVTLTPWKQLLLNALESNSHLKHSSYFQLATIGANGKPSNRTVVFRGFQEDTDKIMINTDSRSHKIEDIKHWPFSEICWYFTDSWEQFRINGCVDIIDGSNSDPLKLQQREKAWFASSLRSRLQYLGPHPGLPSITDDLPKDFSLDPSAGPVDAFCLLILDPDEVDYLNLKNNTRAAFRSSSSLNGVKGTRTFASNNPLSMCALYGAINPGAGLYTTMQQIDDSAT